MENDIEGFDPECFVVRNLDTGEEFNAIEEEESLNQLLDQLTCTHFCESQAHASPIRRHSTTSRESKIDDEGDAKRTKSLSRASKAAINLRKRSSYHSENLNKLWKSMGKRKNDAINSLESKIVPNNLSIKRLSDRSKQVANNLTNSHNYKVGQVLIGPHACPIRAMKFSPNGKYLATGDDNGNIMLWNTRQDKKEQGAGLIDPTPFQTFNDHTSQIMSLSWSRDGFLISGSSDKSARLYHESRDKCLCVFQHTSCVTDVMFHPIHQNQFLSASLDNRLRIWNIPKGRVVSWAQTSNMISSATFNTTGDRVAAGLVNGQCVFYRTNNLVYHTQVECRNRRGTHSEGRPVTDLEFFSISVDETATKREFLVISTNDSRIRILDTATFEIVAKLKGLVNVESPMGGVSALDGKAIISGSEDGKVYVWDIQGLKTVDKSVSMKSRKQKQPVEKMDSLFCIPSHSCFVTSVANVPTETLQAEDQNKFAGALLSAGENGFINVFYYKI